MSLLPHISVSSKPKPRSRSLNRKQNQRSNRIPGIWEQEEKKEASW